MQKKRKQTLTAADEPDSKINKTESTAAEAPQGTSVDKTFSSALLGIVLNNVYFGNPVKFW